MLTNHCSARFQLPVSPAFWISVLNVRVLGLMPMPALRAACFVVVVNINNNKNHNHNYQNNNNDNPNKAMFCFLEMNLYFFTRTHCRSCVRPARWLRALDVRA